MQNVIDIAAAVVVVAIVSGLVVWGGWLIGVKMPERRRR